MPPLKNTTYLRKALLTWYRRSARPLPWRSKSTTPYEIMVSEIMLQQTQAARVAELLPVFLKSFPTLRDLSKASTASVIRAWKGLGYNNRAVRLRDAARIIIQEHAGTIPESELDLQKLPGFGPYTAAAVATFAFGAKTVVLDVNVRRVYSRIAPNSPIIEFAQQIMPRSNASEWYHAVMDLGATVCMARNTKCDECPLQRHCPSSNAIDFSLVGAKRSQALEPTYRGQPNRIWRGRVVSILRDQHAPTSHTAIIRKLGIAKPKPEDRSWLKGLLQGLVRDGIIQTTSAQSVILSSA